MVQVQGKRNQSGLSCICRMVHQPTRQSLDRAVIGLRLREPLELVLWATNFLEHLCEKGRHPTLQDASSRGALQHARYLYSVSWADWRSYRFTALDMRQR